MTTKCLAGESLPKSIPTEKTEKRGNAGFKPNRNDRDSASPGQPYRKPTLLLMLTRKHDIFTWLDYNRHTERQSPLLLLFHGYGSNERDLMGLAPELDTRLRIISVRAPIELAPEMFTWFPIEFTPDGITVDRDAAGRVRDQLIEFIRKLIDTLKPAGNKVFIMGFSQGAVMNYLTAFRNPELLHGVISLSGQLPDIKPEMNALPEGLSALPFLVQHGLFDSVLPITKGRQANEWLRNVTTDLTYSEYPMAHQIDQASLGFLVSWLRSKLDLIEQSIRSEENR
jgi:phospholipase/carboxylesterase